MEAGPRSSTSLAGVGPVHGSIAQDYTGSVSELDRMTVNRAKIKQLYESMGAKAAEAHEDEMRKWPKVRSLQIQHELDQAKEEHKEAWKQIAEWQDDFERKRDRCLELEKEVADIGGKNEKLTQELNAYKKKFESMKSHMFGFNMELCKSEDVAWFEAHKDAQDFGKIEPHVSNMMADLKSSDE